jgi:cell shape-determining protein MreC
MQEQKITLEMLYELLKEFKNDTHQKFSDMKQDTNRRFDDMGHRFDDLNQKFDEMKCENSQRFDAIKHEIESDQEKLEEVYENQQKRIFGLNKISVAFNMCLATVISYVVSRWGQ